MLQVRLLIDKSERRTTYPDRLCPKRPQATCNLRTRGFFKNFAKVDSAACMLTTLGRRHSLVGASVFNWMQVLYSILDHGRRDAAPPRPPYLACFRIGLVSSDMALHSTCTQTLGDRIGRWKFRTLLLLYAYFGMRNFHCSVLRAKRLPPTTGLNFSHLTTSHVHLIRSRWKSENPRWRIRLTPPQPASQSASRKAQGSISRASAPASLE